MHTCGDVVEGDAGAGKRVLHRRGEAIGVAVGGDGDGAAVVHVHQRRAYVLGDRVRVETTRHLAVLYVPPHRYFRRRVLRLRRRQQRRRRRRGGAYGRYIGSHWHSRLRL